MVYANPDLNLEIYQLNPGRWDDFESLLGSRGGCGGCWCMSWRTKKSEFYKFRGDGNKLAMKALVDQNQSVGLLAYIDDKPIGWCAIAPREAYPKLENSKVWKKIDDEQVWAITCFFIAKSFRRKGISLELVKGAINHCKASHIKIIEGYPVVPYGEKIPDAFAWTGFPVVFEKAGFVVAERRSPSKPIMRYYID